MTRMRIVLEATSLLGRRTGVGQYTGHLLDELPAALARAGVVADVAVTTWTARGGVLHDLPAGVRQVGPRVPARALRTAWTRTDRPRVETLVGRCDVMHGTNFVSPPTRRAREVVTVHDLTYEEHRSTVSADSLAYRTLVVRALRRGAHVVTPSRAVADAVRDFYDLPDEQVTPTPLGVDPQWFAPPAPETAGRLDLPDDYVLFVGSLDPRKNLPRLVEAFEQVRSGRRDAPALVLAGPAGRDETLRARPGVHLTGWLDDADLRRVVAGARALALPSIDEGFGLPALEALASGRPVLAADIPALREVSGPYATYVDPHDTDAVADGLERVLQADDGPADRQARRAHAARWTWGACADATVAVYMRTD